MIETPLPLVPELATAVPVPDLAPLAVCVTEYQLSIRRRPAGGRSPPSILPFVQSG
jgi:hypothetical protein